MRCSFELSNATCHFASDSRNVSNSRIGLGGGSIVHTSEKLTIGPDSVGYRITSEAKVFGGDILTTTDVAVSSGMVHGVGDKSLVGDISSDVVEKTIARIRIMLERALDCMKTTSKDIPVYLVGGGAFLIPEDLAGVSAVHRFPHYECANAVGAAIAQVAGEVDIVVELGSSSVAESRTKTEKMAFDRAIEQGAIPDTITIVESEAIPVAYTAGRCRLFAKAAGQWNGEGCPDDRLDSSTVSSVSVNNTIRPTDGVDEVMMHEPSWNIGHRSSTVFGPCQLLTSNGSRLGLIFLVAAVEAIRRIAS